MRHCAICRRSPAVKLGLCESCLHVQAELDEACLREVQGCLGGQGKPSSETAADGWAALVIVLIAIVGVLAIYVAKGLPVPGVQP